MKKGLTLLEFVIDLVIAVIIIGILFYAAVSVWNIFFGGGEKEQAKAMMEELIKTLKTAEKVGKSGFMLQNPRGWWLVSFVNGENKVDNNFITPPILCQEGNCICFCYKGPGNINCDKQNFCHAIDKIILGKDTQPLREEVDIKWMCIENKTTYFEIYESNEKECPAKAISEEAISRDAAIIGAIMEEAREEAVVNRKCNCEIYCQDYANWIVQYSQEYKVDPLLVLSIMMQESSCNKEACSKKDGEPLSCGLMQINIQVRNFPEWRDPEKNIKKGIEILSADYNYCKKEYEDAWKAALRKYLTGKCEESLAANKYAGEVMKRYEKLMEKYEEKK